MVTLKAAAEWEVYQENLSVYRQYPIIVNGIYYSVHYTEGMNTYVGKQGKVVILEAEVLPGVDFGDRKFLCHPDWLRKFEVGCVCDSFSLAWQGCTCGFFQKEMANRPTEEDNSKHYI